MTATNPFKGLATDLHVPLTEGMSVDEALVLFNGFYLTSYKASQFKSAQAFVSSSGYVTLELQNPEDDEVWYTFVNKMRVVDENNNSIPTNNPVFEFVNPLDVTTTSTELMTGPVIITHLQELEFLKDVPLNQPLAIDDLTNQLPFQLSSLLNNYGVLGRWVSGTLGELCTGCFSVLYFGPGSDAPSEYLLGENVDTAVLIKLNQGSRQGVICLQYLQAP